MHLTKDSLDIGIVVTDLAASERFYGDVLGLAHHDDLTHVPGMLIRRYSAGSSLVKLVAIDPPPTPTNPPGGAQGGTGLRYLTFYVEDVDHVVQRCLDAGVEVPQLPTESPSGAVVAKVADPDGNWLEIITPASDRFQAGTKASREAQTANLPEHVAALELCWGSLGRPSVAEYLEAAAAAGWGHVTLRPSYLKASVDGGAQQAKLAALARDLGLVVTTVDSLSSVLPGSPDPASLPPEKRLLFAMTEDECFEIAEMFGATRVQVTNFRGTGAERSVMVDAFGALADRAAARGFDILLEFIPGSGVPDLAAAVDIVTAAGRPNTSVMVDTWHLVRTRGTVEDLRALPPGIIGGLQVSDCPFPPDVMPTKTFAAGGDYVPGEGRLLPGEGFLPLADIVAAASANNPPMLVGIEVFNAGMQRLPAQNAAGLALRSLRRALAAT